MTCFMRRCLLCLLFLTKQAFAQPDSQTHIIHTQTSTIQTNTGQTNIKDAPVNQPNGKQALYQIITSEQYSELVEIKIPKKVNSSFNPDFDPDVDLSFFPVLVKALFIIALMVLVFYIFKHRQLFLSWIKDFSSRPQSISVSDYQDAYLYQGWEKLPAHDKVATVVNQLRTQGHYLSASSILYRASLRWLNTAQQLNIKPATTEMKCLQLMADIEKANVHNLTYSQSHQNVQNNQNVQNQLIQGMQSTSNEFISRIIELWIKLAYAQKSNQHNEQNHHSDAEDKLTTFANNWLSALPINAFSNPANGKQVTKSMPDTQDKHDKHGGHNV